MVCPKKSRSPEEQDTIEYVSTAYLLSISKLYLNLKEKKYVFLTFIFMQLFSADATIFLKNLLNFFFFLITFFFWLEGYIPIVHDLVFIMLLGMQHLAFFVIWGHFYIRPSLATTARATPAKQDVASMSGLRAEME